MIDLHIHVLPGLDDGPSTPEESIEMCRMSHDEGIGTLVATPHVIRDVFDNSRESILEAVRSLNKLLSQEQIPLQVLPGADVRLDHDLDERVQRQELCTINDKGQSLLLELPEAMPAVDLTRSLSGLKGRGIQPVLSHPERSAYFHEHVEDLYRLVYSGALVQITAQSLQGGFGREIQRFAEGLVANRLVHIIASDAHSTRSRPPGLLRALKRATDLIGEQGALELVEGNPSKVVQGIPVDPPVPLPWKKAKKSWWRLGL